MQDMLQLSLKIMLRVELNIIITLLFVIVNHHHYYYYPIFFFFFFIKLAKLLLRMNTLLLFAFIQSVFIALLF